MRQAGEFEKIKKAAADLGIEVISFEIKDKGNFTEDYDKRYPRGLTRVFRSIPAYLLIDNADYPVGAWAKGKLMPPKPNNSTPNSTEVITWLKTESINFRTNSDGTSSKISTKIKYKYASYTTPW